MPTRLWFDGAQKDLACCGIDSKKGQRMFILKLGASVLVAFSIAACATVQPAQRGPTDQSAWPKKGGELAEGGVIKAMACLTWKEDDEDHPKPEVDRENNQLQLLDREGVQTIAWSQGVCGWTMLDTAVPWTQPVGPSKITINTSSIASLY